MPNAKNTEREYWSSMWRQARANMPRVSPKRMGSPTVLRMLLGYKISKCQAGKLGTAQHCDTAMRRGDRPLDPKRQRLLKMLAGPHGKTVVRIVAHQRKIDLTKFKHWP